MNEYYRLAYIRKPEFMGNTRIEEKDPKYKSSPIFHGAKNTLNNALKNTKQLQLKLPQCLKRLLRINNLYGFS